MRKVSSLRIGILVVLLALTTLFVYSTPSRTNVTRANKPPLSRSFDHIKNWQFQSDAVMDDNVVSALQLDDYLFRTYSIGQKPLTLYIGYYHSAKKVGAAHDPLVCFTGQGWQISGRTSGSYTVKADPALKIAYSSMIADRQADRELLVYWFQSNGSAAATTQSQKLAMLLDKFSNKGGDNAFVRISVPIGNEPVEAVRSRIFSFVDDFYPGFYHYMTE